MNRVIEVNYPCTIDDTKQPAMMYSVNGREERPLLVALHTWSFTYAQNGDDSVYARWCKKNNWHYIHPDFRGKNETPESMGSDYVVQDVVDAVEYMVTSYNVDKKRIYLIGVSGGGHVALLMAGRHPNLFAAISAWCGIVDIQKWHEENVKAKLGYALNIEDVCGGNPQNDMAVAEACKKRSPITYLNESTQAVCLDINGGVQDGRLGSVPFSHSLIAFNHVAREGDKIAVNDIDKYYETQEFPKSELNSVSTDLYGTHTPLFARVSENVRVVIFDGGHEIVQLPALNWLNLQRQGEPAKWLCENPILLEVSSKEEQSGL